MIAPEIRGTLRNHLVEMPKEISHVSGIRIFGKLIRSLVFSTDVAIIRNVDADAVIAVYPFTPQPAITRAIITATEIPVFAGVGGGTTTGKRSLDIARDAEFQGAMGVVLNAPTVNEVIAAIKQKLDIPIVLTVVSGDTRLAARIDAGASIFNVSGAANTPAIVKRIRGQYPDFPIIATGGPTRDSILRTIDAGANAITVTPPTTGELFRVLMDKYRAAESIT